MNNIQLHNVLPTVFRDRDTVVSDVWHRELTFERGKTYLVRASSGTGKSSLCSYLMGQRNDYEGIICFDGRNIRTLRQGEWTRLRQMSLSHLFQDMRLFPELSVMENIRIKNNLTSHLKRKRIVQLLEQLGIADKADTKVAHISIGQQQRVAFIRALASPFDFLLFDEPVSHLDDANATIMAQIALEECQKTGAGLIVTSIGRDLPLTYDVTLQM